MNFHNSCVCLHKTDITACIEEGYSRPQPDLSYWQMASRKEKVNSVYECAPWKVDSAEKDDIRSCVYGKHQLDTVGYKK